MVYASGIRPIQGTHIQRELAIGYIGETREQGSKGAREPLLFVDLGGRCHAEKRC